MSSWSNEIKTKFSVKQILSLIFIFSIFSLINFDPQGSIMSHATLGKTVYDMSESSGGLKITQSSDLAINKNNELISGLPPGASYLAMPIYFLTKPLISMLPDSWVLPNLLPYLPEGRIRSISKHVYFLQFFAFYL